MNTTYFGGSIPVEIYRLTKTLGLANLMFHIMPVGGQTPNRTVIGYGIPHPIITRDYYVSINQTDGNNLHTIVNVTYNRIETYYSYNPITTARGQGLILYLCDWDWSAST